MKLYLGARQTTMPGLGEIRIGTLRGMCKQLGIDPKDLEKGPSRWWLMRRTSPRMRKTVASS
jgi:hypothetical protein